jgi:cellulose synthase/poly-beta-1,6-N-acetylglucosamine synthase-like glycosyltransferase
VILSIVWLSWGSLALVVYSYVGYPLLLGVCARLSTRRGGGPAPNDGPENSPSVSVLLPAFNAEGVLAAKLESLLAQEYPADQIEVLVYCDGCTDGTEGIARAFSARPEAGGRIRVFASPERRGKPWALNQLAREAKGELLLLNDARQPLSPNSARALTAHMADPRVGCATGRLVLRGDAGSGVYWRYEDWIRAQESLFRGVVGMTGAIAMMRRADFAELPEDLLLDDVWMPMRLVLLGKRVVSVREAEAYDVAQADENEFRRKVRTLAGNYQLFALLPALLLPGRNPLWLETFSHKILRLLVPWFLLLLLTTSLAATLLQSGTPRSAAGALFAAQVVFYLAALVGRRGGRLAGVARTFLVLNAAAALAPWRYITGSQRVTW